MRWIPFWRVTGLFSLCGILLLTACGRQTTSNPELGTPAASEYEPSPFQPQDVGDRLVGPIVYTVDARAKDLWMYFDFSQGSVVGVQNAKTDAWDIAVQRHVIRTNGGDTNPAGQSALAALAEQDFAAITRVPADAEFVSDIRTQKRLHPYNPAIHKWYDYSYTTNVLVPKRIVYIVRTQDGKYAKMRILSYYCKDDVAGCMTFEYVYQGDGSPNLATPPTRVSHQREQR